MSVRDFRRLFCNAGVCYAKHDCWDVRVRVGLGVNCAGDDEEGSHADVVLLITASEDCRAIVWAAQPDKRGLPEGDTRRQRIALKMTVYACDAEAGELGDAVAVTGPRFARKWTPWLARAGVGAAADFTLTCGQGYLVVARGVPKANLHLRPELGEGIVVGVMTSAPADTRVREYTAAMRGAARRNGLNGFFDDGIPTGMHPFCGARAGQQAGRRGGGPGGGRGGARGDPPRRPVEVDRAVRGGMTQRWTSTHVSSKAAPQHPTIARLLCNNQRLVARAAATSCIESRTGRVYRSSQGRVFPVASPCRAAARARVS